MSFNYARTQATARRLIEKFGQSATFTRISEGEYDAESGESVEVEATFTANVAVLPVNDRGGERADNFKRDGLVDDKRRRLLVEVNSTGDEPSPTDTVAVEGENWRIKGIEPLAPGGVNVLYDLEVERT